MTPKENRRVFFSALAQQIRIIWPIISSVIALMIGLGFIIGHIEEWRVSESVYFTFVTGLTIGYGDLAPKQLTSRVLALFIGFAGIVFTGLIAAVSVQALRAAGSDPGNGPE